MSKPTLDLYIGKRVTSVEFADGKHEGAEPWEWMIVLEGGIEIRNKDRSEPMPSVGLVGMIFNFISLSELDTVMHFTGTLGATDKWSFNPTRHTIFDPAYGTEVIPAWPEELEMQGNVPENTEPSGEPVDPEAWAREERRLEHDRIARFKSGFQDFISEEK